MASPSQRQPRRRRDEPFQPHRGQGTFGVAARSVARHRTDDVRRVVQPGEQPTLPVLSALHDAGVQPRADQPVGIDPDRPDARRGVRFPCFQRHRPPSRSGAGRLRRGVRPAGRLAGIRRALRCRRSPAGHARPGAAGPGRAATDGGRAGDRRVVRSAVDAVVHAGAVYRRSVDRDRHPDRDGRSRHARVPAGAGDQCRSQDSIQRRDP